MASCAPEFTACGGRARQQIMLRAIAVLSAERLLLSVRHACPRAAVPAWDCAKDRVHKTRHAQARHAQARHAQARHTQARGVFHRDPDRALGPVARLDTAAAAHDGHKPNDRFPSPHGRLSGTLPPNAFLHSTPLPQLLDRLRRTAGCRLNTLQAAGTFSSGVSAAKVNDFKPMFGEAFAPLLARYEWWGVLQEDVRATASSFARAQCAYRLDPCTSAPLRPGERRVARGCSRRPALLRGRAALVQVCPPLPPLNASGVFMLYRNTIDQLALAALEGARDGSYLKRCASTNWRSTFLRAC